jgi:hypothetical protein
MQDDLDALIAKARISDTLDRLNCHLLIGALAAALARLREENARLRTALTPSKYTKAAYMGEVRDDYTSTDEDGEEVRIQRYVSWSAVKAVMKMIEVRAALAPVDPAKAQPKET